METGKEQKENFVEVAVLTTSGSYPATGYNRVPIHQKIRVELEKANKELKITDTDGWVARVDGNEIKIDSSYEDINLHGQIDIDWGPRQGGGGSFK